MARSSSAPGRADERTTREVLPVPGLLADHHDPAPARPLAEHRLRPGLPQRAGPALGGQRPHLVEGRGDRGRLHRTVLVGVAHPGTS